MSKAKRPLKVSLIIQPNRSYSWRVNFGNKLSRWLMRRYLLLEVWDETTNQSAPYLEEL